MPDAPDTTPSGWEDKLSRLPLCTITASRVGRVITLAYLADRRPEGADPDEIRGYLSRTLGWGPSDDTLYNRILAPLRTAGKDPIIPVVQVLQRGGTYHKQTQYCLTTAGLNHLEDEKKQILGHQAPLSSSHHVLRALKGLLGTASERPTGMVTNLNVLLRWLVLHALIQIGPSSSSTIQTYVFGCAGEVVFTPQGAVAPEMWPRVEVIRRAVKELAAPDTGAVRKAGNLVHITPTGQALYQRWRPDLIESVSRALTMVEAALGLLDPKQS